MRDTGMAWRYFDGVAMSAAARQSRCLIRSGNVGCGASREMWLDDRSCALRQGGRQTCDGLGRRSGDRYSIAGFRWLVPMGS